MSAVALQLPVEGKVWGPQPGPQTMLAECSADIAILGGQAGGGKSFGLLYEGVKWVRHPRVRGYRAIAFRRSEGELTGGGGLWEESLEIFRAFGGRPRESQLDWVFEAESDLVEDRHRIEFRHLQRESTVYEHMGLQYAVILFDELTHFTSAQFWYMYSRLRSTCGVQPYMRASCNPDPDSFVAPLIAWWIGDDGYPIPERSGVLRWLVRVGDALQWFPTREAAVAAWPRERPISFTFIAARLKDNPKLTEKDPGYISRLQMLGRVDRARLLGDEDKGGNWHVRATSGLFFKKADFKIANEPPSRIVRTVRFWDKAGSVETSKHPNPDWTRGPRVSLCENGEFWIDDLVSARERPTAVLRLMRRTAELDGVQVIVGLWQDSAGAGLVDVDTTATALAGFVVEIVSSTAPDATDVQKKKLIGSSRPKRVFARVWAPFVERGLVYVKRAEWTDTVTGECDDFPDGKFDDIVDGISGAMQLLVGQGMGFWHLLQQSAGDNKGAAR